ncbi:unnamed protein product [Allacma fusca]|uniref:Uncharacterized protein n=1 Tax=Allacma fusca TaxID=39272 RepID=A0A8J2KT14_9HEXA|nr:unnamed protein product [Allacma fusca]
MSFVAANDKLLVLAGRDKVFVASLESLSRETTAIDISEARPVPVPSATTNSPSPKKVSVVCLTISTDSKYLCAADSDKYVYIYGKSKSGWKLLRYFQTEKRLLQMIFNNDSGYLAMTDKCGDVWLSDLVSEDAAIPRKILGHCSVILHTCLNAEGTRIFTCDRDEKIRVSSFPDSYIIKGYYMGHKEAVVSIALVFNDTHLFSVDIESNLKFWKVENKSCALTFNLFTVLRLTGEEATKSDFQISLMRATELNSTKVYLAMKVANYDKVPVFDFDLESLTVQLVGEVPINSTLFDFYWVGTSLFIACPDSSEGLIQVVITEDGKISEPKSCVIPQWEEIRTNMSSFIQFNQVCTIPLRKRVANDGLEKGPCNKVRATEDKVGDLKKVDGKKNVEKEPASA